MDSKLIIMINIIHVKNWFYLNNDIIDIQFSFHFNPTFCMYYFCNSITEYWLPLTIYNHRKHQLVLILSKQNLSFTTYALIQIVESVSTILFIAFYREIAKTPPRLGIICSNNLFLPLQFEYLVYYDPF